MQIRRNHIPRLYYPLSEAVKAIKLEGITISISDMLHIAVMGKIRLFTLIPNEIEVRRINSDSADFRSGLNPGSAWQDYSHLQAPVVTNLEYPSNSYTAPTPLAADGPERVASAFHPSDPQETQKVLNSQQNSNGAIRAAPQITSPKFLILSPLNCSELECNNEAEACEFISAFKSNNSLEEIPERISHWPHSNSIAWKLFNRDNTEAKIKLTPQKVCINRHELNALRHHLVEQQQAQEEKEPIKSHNNGDETIDRINETCYSFEDALKIAREKIQNFNDLDLLRLGYVGNIDFVICPPKNIELTISNPFGLTTNREIQHPFPEFLGIDQDDLYQIEIFGKAAPCDFGTGFVYSFGTLIPRMPNFESDEITESLNKAFDLQLKTFRLRLFQSDGTRRKWRTTVFGSTNKDAQKIPITRNSLYVIRSDFDRLINRDPTSRNFEFVENKTKPRFTISKITEYLLAPNRFLKLSDAAALAKCPESKILELGGSGLIELFTPVPCEVAMALVKSKNPYIFQDIEPSNIPQIVVLSKDDCCHILNFGMQAKSEFTKTYRFVSGEFVPSPPNFYKRAVPVEIRGRKISSKPILRKPETIDDSFLWLSHYKDELVAIEITPDRIFLKKEELEKLLKTKKHIFIDGDNKDRKGDWSDFSNEPTVTEKELMSVTKLSRSTVNNKLKVGSRYWDPDFPKKTKDEKTGRVSYLKSELDAWCKKNSRQ